MLHVEGVGETLTQTAHRLVRPGGVGESDVQPRVGQRRVGGVCEQVFQASGEPGQRQMQVGGDVLVGDGGRAVGGQVDQGQGFGVAGFGEGVGQRGPAVVDAVVDGLGAVQVAEGGVVDAVEHGGAGVGNAADADVAFAVAGVGAGDERVGQDDGAGALGAGGEVGADGVQGRGEDGLVGGGFHLHLLVDHGGVQVGHAVDGYGAVRVVQQDGPRGVGGVGPQVHAGFGVQAGADAEAVGGVVVPADHDRGNVQVREFVQGPVEQARCVQTGNGAVVDVARDEQSVDLLGAGGGADVGQDFALMVDQVFPVEPAAQMPVRGVQEPHDARP